MARKRTQSSKKRKQRRNSKKQQQQQQQKKTPRVRLFDKRSRRKRASSAATALKPLGDITNVRKSRLPPPDPTLAVPPSEPRAPYVLFVRHGDDHERGRNVVRHDCDITLDSRREARQLARKLYASVGVPDVILVSPLLRGRATAHVLGDELRQLSGQDVRPKLRVEPRFGRLFTRHEQRHPEVHAQTRAFHVPIYEDDVQFGARVDTALHDMTHKYLAPSDGRAPRSVWIVTHYVVVRRASERTKFAIPKGKMPFLWTSGAIDAATFVEKFK